MILPSELEGKSIAEVDLVGKNCELIGRLFKYVFKSQPTNICSICSIVAQFANIIAIRLDGEKEEAGESGEKQNVNKFFEKKALENEDYMKKYVEELRGLI